MPVTLAPNYSCSAVYSGSEACRACAERVVDSCTAFVGRLPRIKALYPLAVPIMCNHNPASVMLPLLQRGKGKRHGQLMEEANAKAAQAILRPQNSDATGVLDLHGLHVTEAEEATKAFLLRQQRARHFREVEIITGAGHHSNGHLAKIKVTRTHLWAVEF